MLDKASLKVVKPILNAAARVAVKYSVSANALTIVGFTIGLGAAIAIALQFYWIGLAGIILNRTIDGLDGEVARQTTATSVGAYLDIVLDFIFYSAVIFGFAVSNPDLNALPAAALIFSFIGTGCSFLAFAIFAERLSLSSMSYPTKGFYYINGLMEGTETILFFVAMCIFPQYFPILAWVFFALCVVTTITRVIGGAHTLANETK